MFRILHLPSAAISCMSFAQKHHAETYLSMMEYYGYEVDEGKLFFTFTKLDSLNLHEFSIIESEN